MRYGKQRMRNWITTHYIDDSTHMRKICHMLDTTTGTNKSLVTQVSHRKQIGWNGTYP